MQNSLIENLEKLHTTELGNRRIQKNLSLTTDKTVDWCKDKINSPEASVSRTGKNWYIEADGCVITINAYSYTIITAHKKSKK